MKTFALRFGETFSPSCGTIAAHQRVIDQLGYVWYGKSGAAVSDQKIITMREEGTDRILLIHSGGFDRWWAYIDEISKTTPLEGIPEYYKDKASDFKTWFKITRIIEAPRDIMGKCHVISSNSILSEASKYSMNPCFFVNYNDERYSEVEKKS